MNFNIITLGCKVNQYESQAMREDMLKNGFLLSDDRDRADITIVNSCTVTSVSDAKNRKILNRVRRENPDGIVILTGCMPQAFPEESENFSNCDIVLGNAKRAELVPSIYKFLEEKQKFVHITEHIGKGEKYENLSVSSLGEHTRAFIKIEDGCNRFCSYCIIPYARGRVRSKSLEDLKAELIQVAANGYREVVLVGINLSAYGLDEDFDLADAVECACSVDGIDRVRLGSIEPERMDKEMIARLAAQPKFCPQFHLSLQSGCDNTLKAMNRHYNCSEYAEIVTNLRNAFENSSMTTDVMVGFAGETEEDFNASLKFVKSIGFAKVRIHAVKVLLPIKHQIKLIPKSKSRELKLWSRSAMKPEGNFLKNRLAFVNLFSLKDFVTVILRVTQRTTRLFILIPKIQVSAVKLLM